MDSLLLEGICIGLLFGMPVGAVGALTVQRTLQYDLKAGLLTGLGSSAADCFYAAAGAFGLTVISDFLLRYQTMIHVLGGTLILLMGMGLILGKHEAVPAEAERKNILKMFLASFTIGMTNPTAILTFLFAFSYFEIPASMSFFQSTQLVTGVFLGTYLWWGILSTGVSLMKKKVKTIHMIKINRVFGVILILFSLAVFIRTFM